MSRLNKNFSLDQRVSLQWPGTEIDGLTGSILGCASRHIVDFYIVLLDTPLPGDRAIVLPEGCIEPIGPGRKMSDYTGSTVGWDSDGGRPINPDVLAAAACSENGPRMPQDTRSPVDPGSTTLDDEDLVRIELGIQDEDWSPSPTDYLVIQAMVAEIRRLRAMVGRLQDWAVELDTPDPNAYQKSVGPFIAGELRRRMRGD